MKIWTLLLTTAFFATDQTVALCHGQELATSASLPAALRELPESLENQVVSIERASQVKGRSNQLQVGLDAFAELQQRFTDHANNHNLSMQQRVAEIDVAATIETYPGDIKKFSNRIFGPGVFVNLNTGQGTLYPIDQDGSSAIGGFVQLTELQNVDHVFRSPDGLFNFVGGGNP